MAFLIWPLGLFLSNFKKLDPKKLRLSILLFSAFYGLCFIVDFNSNSDSLFYANELIRMSDSYGFGEFYDSLYTDGKTIDLYQPFVTFLVSIFTNNYLYLFTIFGLVFGYFYANNLYLIVEQIRNYRVGLIGIVLILYLAFIIHIGDGINGVRMWTAAHVFILGVISTTIKKNRLSFMWVLLAPLFHFSLIMPALFFLIFKYTKKYFNIKFVYIFFILSFMSTGLSIEVLRNMTESFLPDVFQEKTNSYVSEAVEERIGKTNQIADPLPKIILYYTSNLFLLFLSTFVFLKRKSLQRIEKELFVFGMSMYSLFNLLSHIPSLGRYLSIASFLIVTACTIHYFKHQYSLRFKRLFYFLLPLGSAVIIIKIRFFLEYPSIWLIIGNPILVMIGGNEVGFYR
jgi:hypothetical protein